MWAAHGPLSIQNGLQKLHLSEAACDVVQRLKVIDAPDDASTATISPSTAAAFGSASVFLQLAPASDCVVLAREGNVPDAAISLSPVQQYNFRVKAGTAAEFRPFQPEAGEPFKLVDLEAEVDAAELAQQLGRHYFGQMLAVNQVCVLQQGGHQLLLRISGANTLSPEEQEDRIGYHCYRGLLTPDTQIFLTEVGAHEASMTAAAGAVGAGAGAGTGIGAAGAAGAGTGPTEALAGTGAGRAGSGAQPGAAEAVSSSEDSDEDIGRSPPYAHGSSSGSGAVAMVAAREAPQSVMGGRSRVQLLNARKRDAAALSRNTVRVLTSDGEWFPVRRKLLRPCIALTKAVRSEEAEEVGVDVDTLTFDRVLIFLEAEALGKPPPGYGIHVVPQLLGAAQKLGLRSLEGHCRARLGEAESRLRWFSAEEIRRRNAAGECLLVLDGMVLDVTRWLPEHPGGSTIIPRQSLNIDCARFFELYHHSRESFLYIQEFYIGEVLPEDRRELPRKEPSADFMQQLAEYTTFRMRPEKAARTHLGQR